MRVIINIITGRYLVFLQKLIIKRLCMLVALAAGMISGLQFTFADASQMMISLDIPVKMTVISGGEAVAMQGSTSATEGKLRTRFCVSDVRKGNPFSLAVSGSDTTGKLALYSDTMPDVTYNVSWGSNGKSRTLPPVHSELMPGEKSFIKSNIGKNCDPSEFLMVNVNKPQSKLLKNEQYNGAVVVVVAAE